MTIEGPTPVERAASPAEPGAAEATEAALISFATLFAALAEPGGPPLAVQTAPAPPTVASIPTAAGPTIRHEGLPGQAIAAVQGAPVADEPAATGDRPPIPGDAPGAAAPTPTTAESVRTAEAERLRVPVPASGSVTTGPSPTPARPPSPELAAPPGPARRPEARHPASIGARTPSTPATDDGAEPAAGGPSHVPVRIPGGPPGIGDPPALPATAPASMEAEHPAMPDPLRPLGDGHDEESRPAPVNSLATVTAPGRTLGGASNWQVAPPDPLAAAAPDQPRPMVGAARPQLPAAGDAGEPRAVEPQPSPPAPSRRATPLRLEEPPASPWVAIGAPPTAVPPPADGPAPVSAPAAERFVGSLVRQARLLTREGGTRLEVELEPPALGRVLVEAVANAAGLELVLVPTRAETVLLLAGALPSLERALAGAVGGPVRARLELRDRPAPAAPPPGPERARPDAVSVVNVTV